MVFVAGIQMRFPSNSRSPVERTIIWGLISLLLVIVIIEACARLGYTRIRERLAEAVIKAEQTTTQVITESDVQRILGENSQQRRDQLEN